MKWTGVLLGILGLFVLLVGVLLAFGLPVQESLRYIYEGALGSPVAQARSLVRAAPLMLCAVGISVAWRSGAFNIGGEGQFVAGGLLSATSFLLFKSLPGGVLGPLLIFVSALGGALYSAFAGWLQVRRGVLVVVSTILLNFIALQILNYAVSEPLRSGPIPLTERLPEAAMLLKFSNRTDLHVGVIFAIVVSMGMAFWMFGTSWGFRQRLVGESPELARTLGLDAGRWQLGAMALSGALCGLAAGIEYTALSGQIGTSFAQGIGFLAIPVALMGGLHPAGCILSGLVFGALFAGTENLARYSTGGTSLIYIIQGIAVLSLLALGAVRKSRPAAPAEGEAAA